MIESNDDCTLLNPLEAFILGLLIGASVMLFLVSWFIPTFSYEVLNDVCSELAGDNATYEDHGFGMRTQFICKVVDISEEEEKETIIIKR